MSQGVGVDAVEIGVPSGKTHGKGILARESRIANVAVRIQESRNSQQSRFRAEEIAMNFIFGRGRHTTAQG
jgi:hypothetical protein